ncbi:MAG: hypothetical protein AAGA56_20635, partial [Myxococcota bacterium]
LALGVAVDWAVNLIQRILPIIERYMVMIGKDIFWDMAWIHELMLDVRGGSISASEALRTTQYYDDMGRLSPSGRGTAHRYVRAGQRICHSMTPIPGNYHLRYTPATRRVLDDGNMQSVVGSAVAYLANEQFIIIQPSYDRMLREVARSRAVREAFSLLPDVLVDLIGDVASFGLQYATTFMTDKIHPYHRAFINEHWLRGDFYNVLVERDRWRWITQPQHSMWGRWMAVGETERTRLVNLDFNRQIVADNYDLSRASAAARANVPPSMVGEILIR